MAVKFSGFWSLVTGLFLAWYWGWTMDNPLTYLVILFWPAVLLYKIVVFGFFWGAITLAVILAGVFAVYFLDDVKTRYRRRARLRKDLNAMRPGVRT